MRSWLKRMRAVFCHYVIWIILLFAIFLASLHISNQSLPLKKSDIYTVEDHTDSSSSHSHPRTERVSGETLLIRIVWVAVSQSSKGLSNVHNQEETYPKIIVIWNWYSYHDNLMDWLRNCRFNIPSKYAQQGMQSGRESHALTHYCGNLTHRTLKQWKHFSVEGPTDENVTPKLEHP